MTLDLDIKSILALCSFIMGIGGTIAVLKFRAGRNESDVKSAKKKQTDDRAELREEDKELAGKLDKIAGMVTDQTDILKSRIHDSEKTQGAKLDSFKTQTFVKLDDLKDAHAKHETRLSVAETERTHMKDEIVRHGNKLTVMPSRD
jgi:hypothetical protein